MKKCILFLIEFIKAISPFRKSNKLIIYYNFRGYTGEDRKFLIDRLVKEIDKKYRRYFVIEYSDTCGPPRVKMEINSGIKNLFARKVRMEIQSILVDFCNKV